MHHLHDQSKLLHFFAARCIPVFRSMLTTDSGNVPKQQHRSISVTGMQCVYCEVGTGLK
jgi:hypothetical protein